MLVVVLGDETMDRALDQPGEPAVFHAVFLVEVKPCAAAADVFEAEPAHRAGARREADRVIAVKLRRAALGDHLPASRPAAQIPGNRKPGPSDQPQPGRIAFVDDLDPHIAVFDHARMEQARRAPIVLRFGMEDRPDLLAARINLPTGVVHDHGGNPLSRNTRGSIQLVCRARLVCLNTPRRQTGTRE
jgi:hypothetical protein